jgi:hypothetical protein
MALIISLSISPVSVAVASDVGGAFSVTDDFASLPAAAYVVHDLAVVPEAPAYRLRTFDADRSMLTTPGAVNPHVLAGEVESSSGIAYRALRS